MIYLYIYLAGYPLACIALLCIARWHIRVTKVLPPKGVWPVLFILVTIWPVVLYSALFFRFVYWIKNRNDSRII
jgi:hypothetical protein